MDDRVSLIAPRLDAKPWGGDRLARFGLPVDRGSTIGEALITAGDSRIVGGFGVGRSLDEVAAHCPGEALGTLALRATGNRTIFPLLAKLIDARENLSIQVHPGDDVAARADRLGKTEAWYVLAAEPDALLFAGLDAETSFDAFRDAAALLDGSSAQLMRTLPATTGQTVLLPAGAIHALGAGVMVYEIQQPSDITYRLDDWGRVDAQGRPRQMHLDQGFSVSRPDLAPDWISPVTLAAGRVDRQILACCRYFALMKVEVHDREFTLGFPESPTVVTLLQGSVTIGDRQVMSGGSAVIWATPRPISCKAIGSAVALVAWVPDLQHDIVEPCQRAGAPWEAIAGLTGETGHLAESSARLGEV